MKRLYVIILKKLSYFLRPLRHGIYLRLLQKAFELQGVRFHGRIGYIHYDAFIDNLGMIEIGDNVVISTKAILLAHDYSLKIKQMLNGGVKLTLFTTSKLERTCLWELEQSYFPKLSLATIVS